MGHDMQHGVPAGRTPSPRIGPERIVIANAAPPNEDAVGKTLTVIAEERGVGEIEAVFGLLTESELDVTMIEHYASDEAVRKVAAPPPAPRRLGRHLRREAPPAALRLGAALPRAVRDPRRARARRGGRRAPDRAGRRPPRRSQIADGSSPASAPTSFSSTRSATSTRRTYDDPINTPDGVLGVWVAGQAVWKDGQATGARPGGVVRTPRRG